MPGKRLLLGASAHGFRPNPMVLPPSRTADATTSAGASVHRRRHIHLHRERRLLLDGHFAHRNRRRGAWLLALRVGLPHADRLFVGAPHRFWQRNTCRQHSCGIRGRQWRWVNAVPCLSFGYRFASLCKPSIIHPKRVDSRRGGAVACEPHRHLRARPDLLERCERRDDGVDALPAAGEPLQPVRGQERLVCRPDVHGPDEGPAGVGRRPQPGAAGCRAARRRPAEHASAAHLDDAHVVRGSAATATAIPSWGSTVAAPATTSETTATTSETTSTSESTSSTCNLQVYCGQRRSCCLFQRGRYHSFCDWHVRRLDGGKAGILCCTATFWSCTCRVRP